MATAVGRTVAWMVMVGEAGGAAGGKPGGKSKMATQDEAGGTAAVASAATRLDFPATRRLRKRRQFLAVAAAGRRMGGKHFLFFVHRQDPGPSPVAGQTRFGITVTRKIGNAVIRNRIKRIVREGCRRSAALFPAGIDLVIVARPSAATAASQEAAAEIAQLARRLMSESGR